MTTYVKTTFAWPEQLAPVADEETGRTFVSRVARHPTRPAREGEVNTWWEPIDPADVPDALAAGGTIRVGEAEIRQTCPGPGTNTKLKEERWA